MKTVLTNDVEEAAAFIKRGEVVAFPTETVYGLGAKVFDEQAIAKIFEAKQRPADNPLIAHISEIEQLDELAIDVSTAAKELIGVFFPGPLTVVVKKSAEVPLLATAGLETIGVRMPRLEIAREFLRACGTPVAAPSANVSGRPSTTTWEAVYEDLDGRIACILQGDATEIGLESTVVECSRDVPELLRKGSVSIEQLRGVVPDIRLGELDLDGPALSPGLRHKHYSPRARVVIGREPSDRDAAFIGIHDPKKDVAYLRISEDVESYARDLFEFFRQCDRRGIATIYCEPVAETGIGAALMDRLRRAAE